jgi:hypothetical protein
VAAFGGVWQYFSMTPGGVGIPTTFRLVVSVSLDAWWRLLSASGGAFY